MRTQPAWCLVTGIPHMLCFRRYIGERARDGGAVGARRAEACEAGAACGHTAAPHAPPPRRTADARSSRFASARFGRCGWRRAPPVDPRALPAHASAGALTQIRRCGRLRHRTASRLAGTRGWRDQATRCTHANPLVDALPSATRNERGANVAEGPAGDALAPPGARPQTRKSGGAGQEACIGRQRSGGVHRGGSAQLGGSEPAACIGTAPSRQRTSGRYRAAPNRPRASGRQRTTVRCASGFHPRRDKARRQS